MKSSRFFDKQGHFRVMFLCNPNRKTNEIALFFIFIQKPLIKLILYHNCRPALRYVAVLTAAIHSCFNSSTGHLSTKLRTAGLHFFETDTVWKVSKYGVISGPYLDNVRWNSQVNPVQKNGQPGINCNKKKVWFFLIYDFQSRKTKKTEVFDANFGSLNKIFGFVWIFFKTKNSNFLTIRGSFGSKYGEKLIEFGFLT